MDAIREVLEQVRALDEALRTYTQSSARYQNAEKAFTHLAPRLAAALSVAVEAMNKHPWHCPDACQPCEDLAAIAVALEER